MLLISNLSIRPEIFEFIGSCAVCKKTSKQIFVNVFTSYKMRMGVIEISFYAPTFVLAWRNKSLFSLVESCWIDDGFYYRCRPAFWCILIFSIYISILTVKRADECMYYFI